MKQPSVIAITATCGRHHILERCVRFFLNQDYRGRHTLLIYNNSGISQELEKIDLPENKSIFLINNNIDASTGKVYTSLGAIYNDILTYIPEEYDVAVHMDDDDIYLPNHISEGVKGLERGGKFSYKPAYSYYRSAEGVVLTKNTLEPSIFVYTKFLKEYKYSLVTTEQHLQWVDELKRQDELYEDGAGIPTLIYNWGDTDISTYKTSGDFHNPNNFNNCRTHSVDHGDRIIAPWSSADVQKYYNVTESQNKKSH